MTLPEIFRLGDALLPDGELHILISGDVYPKNTPASIVSDLQELVAYLQNNPAPILMNALHEGNPFTQQDASWQSLLALAITDNDDVIGVLRHASPKPGAYTPQHQMLLQNFAEQIAEQRTMAKMKVALQQVSKELVDLRQSLTIYNEISRLSTSDQMWESALPHMAEQLTKLFQADACTIAIWDSQQEQPKRLAAWAVDTDTYLSLSNHPAEASNLTQQVIQSHQPVFINDTTALANPPTRLIEEFGAKVLVGLPLMARGHAIGAAFLMRTSSNKPFLPEQIKATSASLDHLALAIDNQLLLASTQSRLQETNALLEVAAIAASSLEPDAMVDEVLRYSRHILNVDAGAILDYDEDNQRLEFQRERGEFGFAGGLSGVQFTSDDHNNPLIKALVSGQTQIINTVDDSGDSLQPIIKQNNIRNLLVAPLRIHDHTLGVFLVANKPDGFSYGDAGLLVALGSHVAAALRNADLLADTRARLNETEILQRIAAITSATLDLDEMLSLAVVETALMFDAQGAELLTLDAAANKLVPHEASQYGIVREWRPHAFPLDGPGHQVEVFHSGLVFMSEDPATSTEMPRRNILTVPLNTQQGVVGVLSIINRGEGPFATAHADLALAIASQIAVGMQSKQLFSVESQRADLMQLINEIAQELSATLDLPGLMRKVVMNVHDTLGYDTVFIFLLDDAEENLICQASATTDPKHAVETGYSQPVSSGMIGRALRSRESILIPDLSQDPDYEVQENHEALSSAMVITLKHGDSVYGVIEILGLEKGAFNETDLLAMQSLASQLGIAIDNARLYHQAQRRLLERGIVHQIGQDLTSILDYSELVHAVARHMARALDTSSVSVAVYDPKRQRIRIEADYLLPESKGKDESLIVGAWYQLAKFHAARRAIMQRKTVTTYVDDETNNDHVTQLQINNAKSELIVPMTVGERVVGLVRWAENRQIRRFTQDDERLAQTLISQAAIAIENARLYREAQRRAHEQSLLSLVTLALTASNSMDELLEHFTIQTHNGLEVTNTVVALIDREGAVDVRGEILTTRTIKRTALGRLQGSTGDQIRQELEEGFSVYVTADGITQTASQLQLALLVDDVSAIALVPIHYRSQMIGIVEVSTDPPETFDEDAVQLLEALANQAAVAIDNMRLSEREQRRLKQLERLQASGRLISSELVRENLLDMVVSEAALIFGVPALAVLMPDKFGLEYVVHTAFGLSEQFTANYKVPIPMYQAASSEERRKPTVYNDLSSFIKDKQQSKLINDEGLIRLLHVPLVMGTRMFGILSLFSRDAAHYFRDEDLEVAQLLASQIVVALDNAELYNASEKRAQELAEANRLRSQFLANISHELRTPMNSILGFSETMISGLYGNLNEKQRSRMERIQRNGANLLALIDDLLDLSKIDAGRMAIAEESIDIRDLVRASFQSVESTAQDKGLDLVFDPPEEVPLITGDSLRVRQIINNLVGNAVKFTAEGSVTVSLESKEEVTLAPKPGEPERQEVLWVSITDTGIGISLEDQLIVFDEFRQVDGSTTRQYGGTGLGLAISKRLVEMMGGRIWVDSEVGVGSTFTFVLPVAESA